MNYVWNRAFHSVKGRMARVSTIPAGAPFVDTLAERLLNEATGDPLALADMLVLLPSRRACRSLRDAFLRVSDQPALMLPKIQPIGDLDPDGAPLDALAALELPPAIGLLKRRLLLTRLLQPLGWSIDHAGELAADLAGLLDELQTENISLEAFEGLVPDHLAEHWQRSRELLSVLASHWPSVLEEQAAIDPAERRHLSLESLADHWRSHPPDHRVIAAGTVGSTPAILMLLKRIASLPHGEIVLPGLDCDLDEASWRALDPTHPQFELKTVLEALGLLPGDIQPWTDGPASTARSAFLRALMLPKTAIERWGEGQAIDEAALRGLELDVHPDPAAEAVTIALRLRGALEVAGQTAALVTPDRALARRVAIELQRFGIEIDDSAGMPLDRTAAGSFLLLTAKMIVSKVEPLTLLAALKHPLARADMAADVFRGHVRLLERLCLRGVRIMGGFQAILGSLQDSGREAQDPARGEAIGDIKDWLERIDALALPFTRCMDASTIDLASLLKAHLSFAEGLASDDGKPDPLWSYEDGEAAATLFGELLEAAGDDHSFSAAAYPALLARLMAEKQVRKRAPGHPRLALWGQLEARLQQPDLIILGGLNETVWPGMIEPGPWLSPAMRETLGLPPLERRIGQAAHDFVQAAAAPQVVFSRAEKDDQDRPTVPSRWLIRLQALLGENGCLPSSAEPWQAWATALDQPQGEARPCPQPAPTPPLQARPRRFSVSDIGLWMKDPYALYAKRVLQLKALEPLNADPGAADRGTMIHDALERFARAFPEGLPEDAKTQLLAFGRQAFAPLQRRPQLLALWWPRFLQVVEWVIEKERQARPGLALIKAEMEAFMHVPAKAGEVLIRARADRLEIDLEGKVALIDYKTGSLPAQKDVEAGFEPQLPLEGMMLKAGAFAELGPRSIAGLRFWQLSGGENAGDIKDATKMDLDELIEQAKTGLAGLIAHYDDPKTAYHATYRPGVARRGDYDHLARLGEWELR